MPQAQQLGRYQLLDRIAFGGMAEIYRAKTFDSEGRARMVAVKRVLQHLTTDDDFMRMLVDEAKLTAILDHPAVAKVYEFSQAGDEFFIAMEYVDGKDVRAVLEKHRQMKTPVPPEHVTWIIAHVADGLHAAHQQHDADGKPMHIVHRDVSPSNILCSYQGDAKLCDFGIAKATLSRVQTRTGVIKGKVKYMSPEQAMGRKLDGRSDLFSLGSVMYELLALEAPFQAATEVELIFAVRDARKKDIRELRPDIPKGLLTIIDRMMERQRADRYQNGHEVARDLTHFLETTYPGYRRAMLGRYLRNLFKDEIEKDLRQLESWILSSTGDVSRVGVNLIADALPDDAEFKHFSPASSLSVELVSDVRELPQQRTGFYKREQPKSQSGELHAQATMITGREKALGSRRGDLHTAATMMLEGRAADALRAQLGVGNGSLHEQQTRILDTSAIQTAAPQARPAPAPSSVHSEIAPDGDFPQAPTRVAVAGEIKPRAMRSGSVKSVAPLEPQATRVASPEAQQKLCPPPPPAPGRRLHADTAPDAPVGFDEETSEPTVPRKNGKRPTKERIRGRTPDFSDSSPEPSVTNPLDDGDLEEV